MDIVTEMATNNDIATILKFMNDYYKIEKKGFDKKRSRKSIEYLLENTSIGSLWIVKCDNKAIGYYCLAYNYSLDISGRDCFLDELFIDTPFRKKGIGTQVIQLIIDYLTTMNFKGIHLLVFNFNMQAFKFYCKNGFVMQNGTFMTRDI